MHIRFLRLVLLVVMMIHSSLSQAQLRKAVILDLSYRNGETNFSRVRSCMRALETFGLPYDTTSQLSVALTYPVVLFTPIVYDTTFTLTEKTDILNYVSTGGTVIASSVRDTVFFPLFGVNNIVSENTRLRMRWDPASVPDLFDRINDSLELEVSFGRFSDTISFHARSYDTTTAIPLASYNDSAFAVFYNAYGAGHAYLFGMDFRDVIIRNQLNADFNAHRTYSNGFEPTSDVFFFFIGNIVRKHIPHSVWLHTAPRCNSSVVMITHDIDSRSGIDTMGVFIDEEADRNIKATYNVTTRYMSDHWMSDFYLNSYPQVHYILQRGHIIGSHSVGHFPDFADSATFPLGAMGNTMGTYNPGHFSGTTTGGTILGELEVSKEILEADHGIAIDVFRAGHLAYSRNLPIGLEMMGYKFNSTYSANDVLTNFPFYCTDQNKFSGNPVDVLEIPMTISDVFPIPNGITMNNYLAKVATWKRVTDANNLNYAPTVLLIHPNRMYKLDAEKKYLDSISSEAVFMSMSDFGNFWRERDSIQFSTTLTNDTLYIDINTETPDPQISFAIDHPETLLALFFRTPSLQLLTYTSSNPLGNHNVYCSDSDVGLPEAENKSNLVKVFPNPANEQVTVSITNAEQVDLGITVFNLYGQKIYSASGVKNGAITYFNWKFSADLPEGYYLFRISGEGTIAGGKFVLIR